LHGIALFIASHGTAGIERLALKKRRRGDRKTEANASVAPLGLAVAFPPTIPRADALGY